MQVCSLAENVDVIEEPVEEVEAAWDDVSDFQEVVCVAFVNDLDPFEFKERLEDAEKLPGFSDFFRDKEIVYWDLSVLFQIIPAAELCEVLEQFDNFVSSLYNKNKIIINFRDYEKSLYLPYVDVSAT